MHVDLQCHQLLIELGLRPDHVPGVQRERHPGGPHQVTKIINISVNFHQSTFKTSNKDLTMLLYSYLREHLQRHVPGVHRKRHPGGPPQVTKVINISVNFNHRTLKTSNKDHPGGPPQVTKIINISVNFHQSTFKTSNKDLTMLLFSYLGEHLQHYIPGAHRE